MLRHCYKPQPGNKLRIAMNFIHACELQLLHAHNEKFYRGINYFRGDPNISEIYGPGGPNIMGVQIFRYRPDPFRPGAYQTLVVRRLYNLQSISAWAKRIWPRETNIVLYLERDLESSYPKLPLRTKSLL